MNSVLRLMTVALVGLLVVELAARAWRGTNTRDPQEGVSASAIAAAVAHPDSVRQTRAATRQRIRNSATYLGHSLRETDSTLRRWPQRSGEPLLVYVVPTTVQGHTPEHDRAALRAFRRWERVGAIPVLFEFAGDSSDAEVLVEWVRSFPVERSGQAKIVWDQDGWIRSATLTLATRSVGGWWIQPEASYTVALHEIGHLLGLGHSDDPDDLMYPITGVQDLTPRDRETARLLYALSPGSLREP